MENLDDTDVLTPAEEAMLWVEDNADRLSEGDRANIERLRGMPDAFVRFVREVQAKHRGFEANKGKTVDDVAKTSKPSMPSSDEREVARLLNALPAEYRDAMLNRRRAS